MFYIILAIVTGMATMLAVIINAKLGDHIGVRQGGTINYIVGLIGSIIGMVAMTQTSVLLSMDVSRVPIYVFFGGIFGVCIIIITNIVVPNIPAVYTALLCFIGQMIAGIAIDYIFLDILSLPKVIGSLLIIVGMAYNSQLEKKTLAQKRVA